MRAARTLAVVEAVVAHSWARAPHMVLPAEAGTADDAVADTPDADWDRAAASGTAAAVAVAAAHALAVALEMRDAVVLSNVVVAWATSSPAVAGTS